MKDGVYEIRLTNNNPFNQYLLVKTYGGVTRSRKCPSIEDMQNQLNEWDDIYRKEHPEYKGTSIRKMMKTRMAENTYEVRSGGEIIATGTGRQLAELLNIKAKTLCNAANAGRHVMYFHQPLDIYKMEYSV